MLDYLHTWIAGYPWIAFPVIFLVGFGSDFCTATWARSVGDHRAAAAANWSALCLASQLAIVVAAVQETPAALAFFGLGCWLGTFTAVSWRSAPPYFPPASKGKRGKQRGDDLVSPDLLRKDRL